MLTYVGLSELSVSSSVCESSDHKQSHYIFPLSFDFSTDIRFEILENHALADTILNISANPDGIRQVVCIEETLSITIIIENVFSTLYKGLLDLLRSRGCSWIRATHL